MSSKLAKKYFVGGVYMIRRKTGGKALIGVTKDFETHRKTITNQLKLGSFTNTALQKDFSEGHVFEYLVLYSESFNGESYGTFDTAPMRKKAREFIEKYDTISNGYNRPFGGPGRKQQAV